MNGSSPTPSTTQWGVAQLAEFPALNRAVAGSNPVAPTRRRKYVIIEDRRWLDHLVIVDWNGRFKSGLDSVDTQTGEWHRPPGSYGKYTRLLVQVPVDLVMGKSYDTTQRVYVDPGSDESLSRFMVDLLRDLGSARNGNPVRAALVGPEEVP